MRPIPEVSAVEVVFPTRALEILPPMSEIPEEFNRWSGNQWVKVVQVWFHQGLKNCHWTPKPGVDTQEALRVVAACIGDWSPKHEHKVAGCAYLLSEWFEDVTYEPAKKLK